MRRSQLPDFVSPSTRELRALWRACGGANGQDTMRRLVAEVVRLRELVGDLDAYCGVVQRAWTEETRSKLVALEKMRILLSDERSRMGGLTSEHPPAPAGSAGREPAPPQE